MGLFDFFKKKEKAPQLTLQVTKTVIETRPLQLEGLDKITPNCYGNYLFTPEADFVVHGINPATNRRNKRIYTAGSEAEAMQLAEADGLTAPFEITLKPADEPTDNQLAYAKDLGLQIPLGACRIDASALISRAEDRDEEPANPEFLTFLAARGWRGSALTGHDFSRNVVYNFVDTPREQLALYAYYIDQAENGLPLGNLDTAPKKEHYFAFADRALQNPKAMEHYKSWRQDKTWSTAKTWGIYKDYKSFCSWY